MVREVSDLVALLEAWQRGLERAASGLGLEPWRVAKNRVSFSNTRRRPGEFSEAVANLHAKTGVSSKGQHEQMKRIVDGRRIVMEQGRLTLDRHVSDHGC